jgi:O-antigen ligase
MERAKLMHQSIIKYLPRVLILLIVVGVSLPMAWISLAKLALTLYAISTILLWSRYGDRWKEVFKLIPIRFYFFAVAFFGFSLVWTEAPLEYASHAWLKHSKVLTIPFLLILLHDPSRTKFGLRWFVLGQFTVICMSWMIYFGVHISAGKAPHEGPIVFSESYIDQSLMFAVSSAVAWHLRKENIWPRWISLSMPCLATLNIIFLLPGRTGYLILFALLVVTLFWAFPRRIRSPAIFAFTVCAVLASIIFSSNFRNSLEHTVIDSKSYLFQQETQTSTGWRLNAWKLSIEAILKQPVIGYGVGSFVPAVESLQKIDNKVFGTSLSSNPHQEFLLWGIELGIGGVLMLVAIIVSTVIQASSMPTSTRRAMYCITIALSIASLLNSALYDDLIGDFLCVALGVCMAFGARQIDDAAKKNSNRKPSIYVTPK